MSDPEFLLLGDALWLDFVNTAPFPPARPDALTDAAAWLRWSKAARIESPAGAQAFEEVRQYRQRLASLATALAAGKAPPPSVVEAINLRLTALEGREQLVRIGGAWRLRFAPERPPAALEAIARSAAETLANPLAVVRRCSNTACGLFFVDDSTGQGRRWCREDRCRNQVHVERRRGPRLTPLVSDE